MAKDGVSLKVKFPQHLYEVLLQESNSAGVPMASLIRLAVKDRYCSDDEKNALSPELVVEPSDSTG